MKTPWGTSDEQEQIAPGIVFYHTPSHGGFKLTKEWNDRIPADWRAVGFRKSGFDPTGKNRTLPELGWYEEDCDWCMVALTFPEYFPRHAAAAEDTFKHWIEPKLLAAKVG